MEKLKGQKVILSPLSPSEATFYYQWMNEESVTNGIGKTCNVFTMEHELMWINEMIAKDEVCFTIYSIEKDTPVGNCALQSINHLQQTAILSIYIGDSSERNKGLGKEAVDLITRFGFYSLNLRNIMLSVFEFNANAIKMYESCGFEKIGSRRGSVYLQGKWYSEIYMDIVRDDVW